MRDLTVIVPGQCLSFYFCKSYSIPTKLAPKYYYYIFINDHASSNALQCQVLELNIKVLTWTNFKSCFDIVSSLQIYAMTNH